MPIIFSYIDQHFDSISHIMIILAYILGCFKTYYLINSYIANNRFKQLKIELKLIDQVLKSFDALMLNKNVQDEDVSELLNQVERLSYYVDNGDINFNIVEKLLNDVYESIEEFFGDFLEDPKDYLLIKDITKKLKKRQKINELKNEFKYAFICSFTGGALIYVLYLIIK